MFEYLFECRIFLTFIGNPRYRYGARAAVCGDTMYLLCGTTLGPDREYSNDLHALDLATWTWRRLSPRGRPPVRQGSALATAKVAPMLRFE